MKPFTLFLLLTVSIVMLPQTSQGQVIASPAYALFRPAPAPPPARPASFIRRAPDYRWEGLAIGAIVGGTLVFFIVNDGCDTHGGCFTDAMGGGATGWRCRRSPWPVCGPSYCQEPSRLERVRRR